MLHKLFKGKRTVALHELVSEHSYWIRKKNQFLRQYILMMILGILTMVYIYGEIHQVHKWRYYFALDDQNNVISIESLAVPQPFSQDEVIDYARAKIYQLFSVTPNNYRLQHSRFFNEDVTHNAYKNAIQNALSQSGFVTRIKERYLSSVESVGEPSVKIGVLPLNQQKTVTWKVTFKDFVLYQRKEKGQSRVMGDLEVWVSKSPYIKTPHQLSVVRLFLRNFKDLGDINNA
ncbi:DotI/IcmL/TraM family protein [Cysteiniphilum marinum]|uniref:DotI/IcmL/TraM family protein n=1 Tax=Cysteiniphilum marinum TaxID=2774191 RepID=UPI00193B664F|nr:DotI/IcmL/TraM family protein [Cysteiniphilum marinum]